MSSNALKRRAAVAAWVVSTFWVIGVLCGAATAAPTTQPASLDKAVATMVAEYVKVNGGSVGVSIVDAATGKSLVAINDDKLYVPASNQKVIASAAAIAELGGNSHFTTSVYRLAGGDVLIRGQFDPTLGDDILARRLGRTRYGELDAWAKAVLGASAGRPVRRILVEDHGDTGRYRHEDWKGVSADGWYKAPVSRLTFNNGCIDVKLTVKDGKVHPTFFPTSRLIRMIDRIKVGPGNAWSLRPNADDSQFTLRGTARKTMLDALPAPVTYPALLLGRTFAERLVAAGATVTPTVKMVPPGSVDLPNGASPVAQSRTPLARAMLRANQYSLNMAADSILLRTGDGTWDGSASAAAQALVRTFGIEASDVIIRDGSGLSHHNRVTPRAMTKVLLGLSRRRDARGFLGSLPISGGGRSGGTLKNRMGGSMTGRVYAKTGFVKRACCLSGYVLDKKRRGRVVFAIMANNFKGRAAPAKALQDRICRLLAKRIDARDEAAARTSSRRK